MLNYKEILYSCSLGAFRPHKTVKSNKNGFIWCCIIYIPHQMLTVLKYIALIGTFFIYTTSGVFSKLASQREFLSPGYIAFLACTVGVLGIYAVLWQQIIKRMDVSLAYMFKGTGVVFGPMLAHFVFGEAITTTNMVGAAIIICGITLYARPRCSTRSHSLTCLSQRWPRCS